MNAEIIPDMTAEAYHAHPALGSTGARVIANQCPAAYRYAVPVAKTEFDVGTAAHLLVLPPRQFDETVTIIDADSYRTKAAQEARDAARKAGRTPLILPQLQAVQAMRDAVWRHPIAGKAFLNGVAEQSMFWTDPETGVRCKVRPDWLPDGTDYLIDLKTSMSADPADFARSVWNYGYHVQAAWYRAGVKAATGRDINRFAFVVVSKQAPHLVSVCWLDEEALYWGDIVCRYARGVHAWCAARDHWPSFQPDLTGPPRAFTIGLPPYAVKDLQARYEAGGFEPPAIEEKAA